MNSDSASLQRQLARDVQQHGGFEDFRKHALKHQKLKTVIKESHCSQVRQLEFNFADDACRNLFATVGHDQATVYDDAHIGDHVSVVVNYATSEDPGAGGGELLACAWLSTRTWSPHPHGDAALAVAGVGGAIHVISVAEARVVACLTGHTSDVVELCGARQVPGRLLSLAKDGNVRLWDVAAGVAAGAGVAGALGSCVSGRLEGIPDSRPRSCVCLLSLATDAFTVALHPSGAFFLSASRGGRLWRWQLSSSGGGSGGSHSGGDGGSCAPQLLGSVDREALQLPNGPDTTVDSICFLPGAPD